MSGGMFVTGIPTIPLESLAEETTLNSVFGILTWMIELLRAATP